MLIIVHIVSAEVQTNKQTDVENIMGLRIVLVQRVKIPHAPYNSREKIFLVIYKMFYLQNLTQSQFRDLYVVSKIFSDEKSRYMARDPDPYLWLFSNDSK